MIRKLFLFLGVAGLVGLYTSAYRIGDTACGVQLRASKLLVDHAGKVRLLPPGIHFKVPFLDSIIRWDTRIQHTALRSMPLITTEDIAIRIDYRVSWRIQEPLRYIEWMIKTQLDTKSLFLRWLNDYLPVNWQPTPLSILISDTLEPLKAYFENQAKKIGIEIMDCKIIQKMPSPHFKKSVLARMSYSQIDSVDSYVNNAKLNAATIQAKANTQQAMLLAKAQEKAEEIKNEGEAEAMRLYTEAYRKNQKFAHLYQHLISEIRSLDSDKSKLMVVQIDSPLSG